MVNYPHHLKLLLLLLLLCPLALGLGQEDLEPLHRNKRTLTTICVEIQPNGPQNEPYFMCKGADFTNGATPAATPQAADHQQQQQPIYNFPQPGAQLPPQVPFSSFPSFGAGFFPAPSSYEDASNPKATPPSSSQQSHGAQYGSAAAASFPPATAPQSYGLPAVSYPTAGGPAAAPGGTFAGPRPASTPTSYADAGAKKPPPVGQTTPMRKSQPTSGQTSNGNEYQSLMDSRHRVAMDEGVLAMPNVGFQPEELNTQYRRPIGVMEPPMMLMQLQQPAPVPHPYYEDHIMRTFYESLGHQEPQVAQAAPLQQAAHTEPLVAPAYPSPYAAAATAPEVSPPPAPPTPPPPPAQPTYSAYPKSSAPFDGNACNSCNRPCSAPAETCPSFQPVIIAMPCYGQQQPTHYLAVPGSPLQPLLPCHVSPLWVVLLEDPLAWHRRLDRLLGWVNKLVVTLASDLRLVRLMACLLLRLEHPLAWVHKWVDPLAWRR
ncbi:leucine-rich repeat extensin-like protein 5 isoform X1 [Drosophila innubila]|uniref:leucine-rich repeat extensin-like protein 5 isoform X1 n=1 Tax=Drosophila innubila TaxID=198719 RepID=UPI00148D5C67|nr:leucine-rich repeat extensin-like protein 5 isoform X1 [Drosophila innubila]XP_034474246.1 leucine-rich repeat extensin-like protein 5 isoform X1 [Drosophila innubila]